MTLQEFIRVFEEIVLVEPGVITADTQMDTLEDWDSLSRASLLATIEEEFELKVDEAKLKKITTFSEILDLVKDKLTN